jgi:HAD superfamily hydrolase (TIGR01490 family)
LTLQLVFFDLDGTITRRDTLLPYVGGLLLRRPWRLPRLLCVLPALWRFARARADHGELKGALLRWALGGLSRATLARYTDRWVARLLARGLHADARRAIDAHRAQQDYLVLMSASVDLYVPAIARALGFAETVCSTVRWHGERLDGTLSGANVRGLEKAAQVRRLRQRFADSRTIAYGNSRPDLPHMEIVDQAWMINPGKRLARELQSERMEVVSWR